MTTAASPTTAQELLAQFDKPSDTTGKVERETALKALAYLLGASFEAAEKSQKNGAFSLSFKVTFDRSEEPTSVKAVSRCSQIFTEDVDLVCQGLF